MVDTPWLGQAFSFFCNGEHRAGVTASLTPPALTATTAEQRGGGMLGPITRVTIHPPRVGDVLAAAADGSGNGETASALPSRSPAPPAPTSVGSSA